MNIWLRWWAVESLYIIGAIVLAIVVEEGLVAYRRHWKNRRH